MTSAIKAGILAGISGVLTFLIIHHFWIAPIWFVLPIGLFIAVGGGASVGWSYAQIGPKLPEKPFTTLSVIGIVVAVFIPALVISLFRQPLLEFSLTEFIPRISLRHALWRIFIELIVPATLVGGVIGWWLGRTWQSALSTALAGFSFALGPGHNIPFFFAGFTLLGPLYVYPMFLVLIFGPILVSSLVLVHGSRWLEESPL